MTMIFASLFDYELRVFAWITVLDTILKDFMTMYIYRTLADDISKDNMKFV
jgi:uncharacterized membrane protein YdjX (TVP38/TMEM64 family)